MVYKVLVFTVTGDQGSSVARYLIEDGGFEIYGVTRNPESAAAKKVAALGVHLIKGDLGDPESYKAALQGMHGVFLNHDFFVYFWANGQDADDAFKKEVDQAKLAADLAVEAGVKHIVYSTLDELPNEYRVPHFDSKATVSKYLRERKYPVTNLVLVTYYSNFTKFGYLQKQEDGTFILQMPLPKELDLPMFAVEQTGGWALAAFKNPEKYLYKDILVAGEVTSIPAMAQVLSEVSGKKVLPVEITREYFYSDAFKATLPYEFWLHWRALIECGTSRDVKASAEVLPDQWDTRAWAENNADFKAAVA